MKNARTATKSIAVFSILASLLLPVNLASAADDNQGQQVAQFQSEQLAQSNVDDPYVSDTSTTCYGGQTPFVRGVIKDPSGQPLAGARVIMTVLGVHLQTGFYNASYNFTIEGTAANGSYSMCSEEGTWAEYFNSLQINYLTMVATVVPPTNTSSTAMATTLAKVVGNGVPTTDRDSSCLKPASLNTSCVMNITMRPAVISGLTKKQDQTLFPKSVISLEYLLGATKWVRLGELVSNEGAWFGFAGFDANNSFRLRIQPPMCMEEIAANCPYQNLGSVADNFTVVMGEVGNPDTATAKWLENNATSRDFVIQPANFIGYLKSSDGSTTIADGVQLIGTMTSPARGQTSWVYGGRFVISLENGTWTLVAKNAGGAFMKDTTFTVTVASGTVSSVVKTGGSTICSAASTPCGASINLPLNDPNFYGYVKDDIGNPVSGAWISIMEYDASAQSRWKMSPIYAESGNPNSGDSPKPAGLIGMELPAPAILRVNLYPPEEGDSEVTSATYYLKTTVDGAGIKVQRCANYNGDPQITPCSTGYSNTSIDHASNTIAPDVNGKRTLVMPTANFKGVACTPGSGSSCTIVGSGYVNVMQQVQPPCQNCSPYYSYAGISSSVRTNGTFSLTIANSGKYRLELSNARNEDGSININLAKATVDFEAVTSGSSFVYYKLDSSGARTDQQIATTAITNAGDRYLIRYSTPSLIGVVKAPDGTPNRYSGVEVQKDISTEMCPTCREGGTYANLDDNGVFSLALTAGRYYLNSNPSFELTSQNLTRTEFKLSALDCDSNGSVELYTFESTQCTGAVPLSLQNGRVIITLQGANFAGTLRNPSTNAVVPYASIQVTKLVTSEYKPDEWQYINMYANTSQTGVFGLTFTSAGRYRVQFQPPQNLQSQFSSSFVVVDVAGSGTVTVTPVADSEVWSADGTGKLNVKLSYPNVSGTISLPAGVSWPANGATSWITIEKWFPNMCGNGCYSYTAEANGVSSSNTGAFATTLTTGQWRMTINPPSGVSGVSRVTREIVVTSQKHVCNVADSADNATTCPISARINPGNFNVTLPPPNFSGTVRNPGNPGSLSMWTQVQFFTWNAVSNYWQWTNLSVSTDNNGRFGVNLTENTTYKVSFEAAWTATGVSAATKYVRVCDSGLTVQFINTEALAKSGNTCTGSGTVLRDQTVTLLGANMSGIVKDATGTALSDVWVSIQNCGAGAQGDICTWERGVNTKNLNGASRGTFDIRLDNDPAVRAVTKYVIDFNPPWNSSSGLVRLSQTVWVRDFDGNGSVDWCLAVDYTTSAQGGTCTNVKDGTSQWQLTMTAGNLAGKVFAPTGTTAVPNAQIQVEKWSRPDWDPQAGQYGWQWVNSYASANQAGVFGLDLKDAGLYRLSVLPGWENPNSYARRRYVVRVHTDSKWCIKTGLTSSNQPYPTNTATPDDASCTFITDNEADAVTGFTARVSSSNLIGVLYTSSTDLTVSSQLSDATKKVGDAWIGLSKKTAQGWWEWQGGSNTSGAATSRGRFGMNITEDGDYQLEVNPAWNSAGQDAPFKLTFAATNCATTCQLTTLAGTNVVQLQDMSYVIKYLAPNFNGIVKDKTGATPIAGSWISVMNSTTGEWIGGTSTGWNGTNAGKFAMKLPDGTYRVEVWPRWDDFTNGIRRVLTVTVSGGVVTACGVSGCEGSGGSWTIKLMGETVTGKVYYPGLADTAGDAYATATSGNQTVMSWAWAEALSCSDSDGLNCHSYVESQSSNQQGVLKMGLADQNNPYLIRIYPNWSLYAGSPVELLVKVTGGVSTWKYRSETAGYEPGPITPDFGHIPPNVNITISGVDSSRFVDLYQCDGATCATGGTKIATVLSSFDGSTWKANFLVSNTKSYRAVVITKGEDDLTNPRTVTFTYDSSTKKFNAGSQSTFAHTFAI